MKQQTLRRRAWKAIRFLFMLYLLTALGCAAMQRKLIYYPTVAPASELDRWADLHGLQRWKNAAGESIGWYRSSLEQPPRGHVLITHGNGGCALHRLDFANPLRELAGMDVFILEYPGYGDRSGRPTENSLFAAAEHGFQSLPKTAPIYLIGESLGTGVASYLAGAHREVSGVLLFAPFGSMVDVAQHHMVFLPANLILRDRFESAKYLSQYQGPVAILVGGKDDVVPEKFGRRLFDGYTGPKQIWRAAKAGHNDIHAQSKEYWKEIIVFWQTNAASGRQTN